MGEVYEVAEVSSAIKKRESKSVDGDEVVTVDHFASSVGNEGQLL